MNFLTETNSKRKKKTLIERRLKIRDYIYKSVIGRVIEINFKKDGELKR